MHEYIANWIFHIGYTLFPIGCSLLDVPSSPLAIPYSLLAIYMTILAVPSLLSLTPYSLFHISYEYTYTYIFPVEYSLVPSGCSLLVIPYTRLLDILCRQDHLE